MPVLHPLPPALGFCAVVPNFLSGPQCEALVARAEAQGFASAATDYPPSYRDNERIVLDDEPLALSMRQLLRPWLAGMGADERLEQGQAWRFDSVNERLRFCRYRAPQAFHLHQDGVHQRGEGLRSRLTFMVYLNDGDEFGGGDTVFFAGGPGTAPGQPQHAAEVARLRPRRGSLIVFDHGIWHAGAQVTRGVKHVMRSDLLYRRVGGPPPAPLAQGPGSPGHEGYVWALCALPGGALASGGRDAVVQLWKPGRLPGGVLWGHTQSVLGLAAWQAHGAAVRRVRFGVDSREVLSAGEDGHARAWPAPGAPLSWQHAHGNFATDLLPLPDGGRVSCSYDGRLVRHAP